MSINRATGSSPSSGGEFNLADPVGSFVSTVQRVVTVPASFFSALQRRGDFVSPLAFAMICFVIGGVLTGIFGLLLRDRGVGGLISSIILSAILLPIFLFVWAAILRALVILFVKPSNSGFEATFRTAAYTFPLSSLVSWIPFVGGLVSLLLSLYAVYLNIIGIREMHSTTMGSAVLVVLIPVVVLTILGACLAVIVVLGLLAALGGGL